MYVKPDLKVLWNESATKLHSLHKNHSKVINVNIINYMWNEVCKFINKNINNKEIGILVAWNWESCDLKWIYKLTQALGTTLSMPHQIEYFFDPLKIIKHYKSCRLKPCKSKLNSLSFGVVWKFIKGKVLENAHNNLIDTIA